MLKQKSNFNIGKGLRRLPLVCSGLLVLLAVVMLCPLQPDNVNADSTSVSAYLPSTVTLTMAPNVSASVEPTSDGVFKKMSATVGVKVTSSDAFSVSIRGDSEMHGATSGNSSTIGPVAANSTEATFGKNKWGYSWAEGNTASATYNPVPASDTTLVNNQKTTNNQADKNYTLGFGAKVDNTIQADTYTGSVTISVVATPQTIVLHNYSVTYNANGGTGTTPTAQTAQKQETSWSFTAAAGTGLSKTGYNFAGWSESSTATEPTWTAGATINLTSTAPQKTLYAVWKVAGAFGGITYMQDMTKSACQTAAYGDTAQLTDRRDNNKYWVTKLADGNCWMTQNLDFNIPSTGITTAESNLNWNPSNPTNTSNLTNNSTATNTNSWDQGMYVYNDPQASASCGTSLTGISACINGAANSGKTFINVGSGYTASTDPNFTKTNGSPVNTTTKTYDAHYLIGNYYSYNAATAGTGASVSTEGANATGNICPKGWDLPSAGAANESGNSFYRMLNAQGITVTAGNDKSTSISTTVNAKNATGTGTTSMSINQALTSAPLFFVRSGLVEYDSKLYLPGYYASYWSRSSYSNAIDARYLYFNSTDVYPSSSIARNAGLSLRCLYAGQ